MGTSTLERTVVRIVSILADFLCNQTIVKWENEYTMSVLKQKKKVFKNHPYALYATDVIFFQANRPSGNHQESKPYFSNKHKQYGYKMEASVLPNGLLVNYFGHFPGSVSDITILKKNKDFHLQALRKTDQEMDELDVGLGSEDYPESWALIVDKGYQGSAAFLRAILPKKKPNLGVLNLEEKKKNKKISEDRIIVENFFGRFVTLWSVFGRRFRLCESSFNSFFKLAAALTNIHVKFHPLRAEEGDNFAKFIRNIIMNGRNKERNRKDKQQEYRENRRARIDDAAADDEVINGLRDQLRVH